MKQKNNEKIKNFSLKNEELNKNYYIDDNSLYVLLILSFGLLSNDPEPVSFNFNFGYFTPPEWNHKDMIKFLFNIAEQYKLEIITPFVLIGAVQDEYETSFYDENNEPKKEYIEELEKALKTTKEITVFGEKTKILPAIYEGAYKWGLDKSKKEPKSEFSELFLKFNEGKISVDDIKKALWFRYNDKILSIYEPEDSEQYLSTKIFSDFLDYTSFRIKYSIPKINKLKQDLNFYIDKFINNKLEQCPFEKNVNDTYVKQCENIFKFEKHKEILMDYFKKMREDFGDNFKINNHFEKGIEEYGERCDKEEIKQRYKERKFLFIHGLFSLLRLDYLKLKFLGTNWSIHEDEPMTYTAKIILTNKAIAEIENEDKTKNKQKITKNNIKSMPKKEENIKKEIYFDEKNSQLYFLGKIITISKSKNSNPHYLLKTIFKNPNKIWNYDEIWEDIGEKEYTKTDWKKIYYTGYSVNEKVAKKTTIEYFLSITKTTIQINEKYL